MPSLPVDLRYSSIWSVIIINYSINKILANNTNNF